MIKWLRMYVAVAFALALVGIGCIAYEQREQTQALQQEACFARAQVYATLFGAWFSGDYASGFGNNEEIRHGELNRQRMLVENSLAECQQVELPRPPPESVPPP
jgi:hypothetical protein